MSKVWIINQYSSTPNTGFAGRHHYFAKELARRGHDVTLVGAQWHHLLSDGATNDMSSGRDFGYEFISIPVHRYKDAHSPARVSNWFLFKHRLRHLPERIGEWPDTILYSSPSLIGFDGAKHLARKLGSRLVFEVRDIWPLTLEEVGGKSPLHPLIFWMQHIEDRAYQVSDAVISNLPNAIEHMTSRGLNKEKFCWIPNGFSREELDFPEPLNAETEAQFPRGKFLVGYAGTIGAANSIQTLIDAATILKGKEEIEFAIVGGGRETDSINNIIAHRGLKNIRIINPVAKSQVQSVMSHFDLSIICWMDLPLYRFGISANKIPEYLYAGRPIINCYSGFEDPIAKYQAGASVAAENPTALADAIVGIKNLPDKKRRSMGVNGRRAAIENFEYQSLTDRLEHVLFPKPLL